MVLSHRKSCQETIKQSLDPGTKEESLFWKSLLRKEAVSILRWNRGPHNVYMILESVFCTPETYYFKSTILQLETERETRKRRRNWRLHKIKKDGAGHPHTVTKHQQLFLVTRQKRRVQLRTLRQAWTVRKAESRDPNPTPATFSKLLIYKAG